MRISYISCKIWILKFRKHMDPKCIWEQTRNPHCNKSHKVVTLKSDVKILEQRTKKDHLSCPKNYITDLISNLCASFSFFHWFLLDLIFFFIYYHPFPDQSFVVCIAYFYCLLLCLLTLTHLVDFYAWLTLCTGSVVRTFILRLMWRLGWRWLLFLFVSAGFLLAQPVWDHLNSSSVFDMF